MPHAYPLMLDLSDRLVVIIGGGAVAVRKANGVLEAGASRVRMVAPTFAPDAPAAAAVERVTAAYDPRHLDGAGLVFASTDSAEVNTAVVRDARARGVLVCRADADDDEPGDFATPAKFACGPVLVTVSAGSAALSARVRDGLAERFDPAWASMAEAMQTLRPLIKAASTDQRRRAEIFRALATPEAMNQLGHTGLSGLKAFLAERFPELAHG